MADQQIQSREDQILESHKLIIDYISVQIDLLKGMCFVSRQDRVDVVDFVCGEFNSFVGLIQREIEKINKNYNTIQERISENNNEHLAVTRETCQNWIFAPKISTLIKFKLEIESRIA